MGIVRSGASRERASWSCRRAPRPMVRGALIWDAKLGFGACAAQEFGFVDDRDAERLRLFELRAGVGAHDDGGRLLGDAVRDVATGAFDGLRGPAAGERGEGTGDHVELTAERALRLGCGGLRRLEAPF